MRRSPMDPGRDSDHALVRVFLSLQRVVRAFCLFVGVCVCEVGELTAVVLRVFSCTARASDLPHGAHRTMGQPQVAAPHLHASSSPRAGPSTLLPGDTATVEDPDTERSQRRRAVFAFRSASKRANETAHDVTPQTVAECIATAEASAPRAGTARSRVAAPPKEHAVCGLARPEGGSSLEGSVFAH